MIKDIEEENSINNLLQRSLSEDPIGLGSLSKVCEIKDSRFNRYLLRTSRNFDKAYHNSLRKYDYIVGQNNLYEGRNFGQTIFTIHGSIDISLNRSLPDVDVILKAGTCLSRIYSTQLDNYSKKGAHAEEASRMSHDALLDKIISLTDSTYEKIADDVQYLIRTGRRLDGRGHNVCLDGDKINFIDTFQYYGDSSIPWDNSKEATKNGILNLLTGFDKSPWDEKKRSDSVLDKHNLIKNKIDKAFADIEIIECISAPNEHDIYIETIKPTMSADKLLKRLHELEKNIKFS